MLVILSLALLPLGLIALFASLDAAHENRRARQLEGRIVAVASARQLDAAVTRSAISLRAVATALSINAADARACRLTVDALSRTQTYPIRFAIFTRAGQAMCATDSFAPPQPLPAPGDNETRVEFAEGVPALRFAVTSADGAEIAIGELPYATLTQVIRPLGRTDIEIVLRRGEREIALAAGDVHASDQITSFELPVLDGHTDLVVSLRAAPIAPAEAITALLPLLMWVAAAIISWSVMNSLLLRPLSLMQKAVSAYRAGDTRLAIPEMATPATEIRRLSDAFQHVAQTVATHEAELEQAIARQVKLTREVHHRVKNNLQVIASLLNLHARGAASADVAAAYASIQRRVDALAVVHRHNYAADDETQGIDLRPLMGEIAANLKAGASEHPSISLTLEVAPLRVSQDVAAAVAFLLTEVVDLAVVAAGPARIAIALRSTGSGRGMLSIQSNALTTNVPAVTYQRYVRILEGLSRQLRSALHRDDAVGLFEIEINGLVPEPTADPEPLVTS